MSNTTLQGRSIWAKWTPWLGVTVIAVATFVSYLPAMRAGFIWNDDTYVSKNRLLDKPSGLAKIWLPNLTGKSDQPGNLTERTEQYYPLVFTSYWLESRLWGNSNPMGFHVVNVLLHVLNALLVWSICHRLGFGWAWFAGLIFALHPVEVESVAWIAERKNVLSGLFYLLAVASYLRFNRTRAWALYAASLGCFVLALLSKTVTCTLPAILLLLLWHSHQHLRWADLLRLLPFFAVGVALGLFTVYYERNIVGAEGVEWQILFWQRCVIAGRAVCFYISKILCPIKLTFIYPRWNPSEFSLLGLFWPTAVIAVAGILWYCRKALGTGLLLGWLGFVLTLFPALGFFDVYPFRYSFVADHFQYLASIFSIGLFVGLLHTAYKHCWPGTLTLAGIRSVTVLLSLAIVALLGSLSWAQAGMYQDIKTLWKETVRKNPKAWIGWNNLGSIYNGLNQHNDAIEAYTRAIEVKPDAAKAYRNLGASYAKLARNRDAISAYKKAIEIKPDYAGVHRELGVIYLKTGRHKQAIQALQLAAELRPDSPINHNSLGVAYVRTARHHKAIEAFKEACRLKSAYTSAHYNLGIVHLMVGDKDSARQEQKILRELDESLAKKLLRQIHRQK